MEGKVFEGEIEKLIDQGSARFSYRNIDFSTNYGQSEVTECASKLGANTFEADGETLMVLWRAAANKV